jgi:hypothetical protein
METIIKSSILVLMVLLLAVPSAQAQFQKGDWELGMTFAAGSYKESREGENETWSYSATYISMALTPGYYVLNGFSVEPEFSFYALQHADPTFQLLGNLSYTGWLPGHGAAWFARAGAGISNTYPFAGQTVSWWDVEESVTVLNFGAGIKAPVSQHVALRTELNYRIYRFTHQSNPYEYPSGNTDYNIRDFALRIGFSILL